ncbi:MAG: histidine kinase [Hyphomicrobiaceae bacterium]|nr:histidine kinase [Hyphomicrobiaceae bacterium]
MPLYLRLSLTIWALLSTAFAVVLLTMLIEAGPRVRAETQSVMRLARDVLALSIDTRYGGTPTRASLEGYVARLGQMRHVAISLTSTAPEPGTGRGEPATSDAGTRFLSMLGMWQPPETIMEIYPLADGTRAAVRFAARPADELAEVFEAVTSVTYAGICVALGVLILAAGLIARALQPLATIAGALSKLEDGDYSASVAPQPLREFNDIVTRFNGLSQSLRASRVENQRLSRRLVEIADAERGEIAGELHDELGPWLFSVRAEATALRRESEKPEPSIERMAARTAAILAQIEAIQETNRRVLRKLSPIGLDELGLAGAVEGLAGRWRAEHPGTHVDLTIGTLPEGLDRTQILTVYRMVQEGLTNAFRHASASRITIAIGMIDAPAPVDAVGACEAVRAGPTAARPHLLVEVIDDGRGRQAGNEPGLGLVTMRQRVEALSGTLSFADREGGGAVLRALLPVEAPAPGNDYSPAEPAPRPTSVGVAHGAP